MKDPADRSEADTDLAAARLGQARRRLFLFNQCLSLLWPGLLWWSGVSSTLWQQTAGLVAELPRLAAYTALLWLLLVLLNLPSAWYGGFRLRHRYGLSRQTPRAWLADWAKSVLLALVFGVLVASAFYSLHRALGAHWWWSFAGLLSLLALLVTFVAPYVIVPLFFRMRPLEQAEVVAAVRDLAARAGAAVREVCSVDFSRRTVEANAAVIGLGRSRRVVLADTLLATFTLPELRVVVAHELAHHVHRDVGRLLTAQLALVWCGLGLAAVIGEPLLALLGESRGLGWPANLPLLLLGAEVFGLLTLPWTNLLTRRREAAADRFALQLAGEPAAFVSAMLKLARQNLAEIWPPRWAEVLLHTHPAIGRRILVAESIGRAA